MLPPTTGMQRDDGGHPGKEKVFFFFTVNGDGNETLAFLNAARRTKSVRSRVRRITKAEIKYHTVPALPPPRICSLVATDAAASWNDYASV